MNRNRKQELLRISVNVSKRALDGFCDEAIAQATRTAIECVRDGEIEWGRRFFALAKDAIMLGRGVRDAISFWSAMPDEARRGWWFYIFELGRMYRQAGMFDESRKCLERAFQWIQDIDIDGLGRKNTESLGQRGREGRVLYCSSSARLLEYATVCEELAMVYRHLGTEVLAHSFSQKALTARNVGSLPDPPRPGDFFTCPVDLG